MSSSSSQIVFLRHPREDSPAAFLMAKDEEDRKGTISEVLNFQEEHR